MQQAVISALSKWNRPLVLLAECADRFHYCNEQYDNHGTVLGEVFQITSPTYISLHGGQGSAPAMYERSDTESK